MCGRRPVRDGDNLAKRTLWPGACFIGSKLIALLAAALEPEESERPTENGHGASPPRRYAGLSPSAEDLAWSLPFYIHQIQRL